jgi:anti-sigma factor RsiW
MINPFRRLRRGINCRRATELMTDYLEGALSVAERTRFEAHLARCDGCTAYLDQMRSTVAALGRLAPESLPADVRDELVDLYRRFRSA